jgi:hypothetical protein
MDLERMLERCERDQWSVAELDWAKPPRPMSKDAEMAIVQLFTDMSAIERLAGALFVEQRKRVKDPTLKAIFGTFVRDEVRHAQAAMMLADYYNVRHLKAYATNPSVVRFAPHFIDAVRYVSDEVANAYITAGELILDIALLRSINDYVDDDMSHAAMRLINRDESRHIAIDYHMVEYYASDAHTVDLKKKRARATLAERATATRAFWGVIAHATPFFRGMFFEPMSRVDPSGVRLREAVKRFQLLGAKPGVKDRPFAKFMDNLQHAYEKPALRALFGPVIVRLAGVPPQFVKQLNSETELALASSMSFEALADEALAVKLS